MSRPAQRPSAPVQRRSGPAGRRSALAAAALLAGSMLAGCMVGPDYRRARLDLPDVFDTVSGDQAAAEPLLRSDWWTAFGDRTLDTLVAEARQRNADLAVSTAQIEEAQAVLREAGATYYPEVDLAGSTTRQRVSTAGFTPIFPGIPLTRTLNQLALSTTFELDFWGKLRRAAEAARAQLLNTVYARDTVALTLAGTVSQSYFLLRSLDAQAAVLRTSLASRDETLRVVNARARAGYVSDLDVEQAQAVRSDAAAQLQEVLRQRALVEHQLGVLTAHPGLRIAAADLAALPVPPALPPGLPSTLVERRPDVRAAEQAVAAASARIGVARAAQLPTFSLTGLFGGQSRDFDNLLSQPARIWSLGLSGSVPIFDAGRYAARTEQAEARQRQALANWRRSVEVAFREVADALASIERAANAEQALQRRLDAARRTERIARLRYEAGYSSFLELLDAQRTVNDAELAFVRNRQTRLAYGVDLAKALGGGWTDATAGSVPAVAPLQGGVATPASSVRATTR